MQANPMRSLYGFAKQREEEANGLTQILGQVLGQNADLSGNQQQQQQPMVQDALFRTPPGSDQTPFKTQNMPFLTPPGSDQTPFVPQLLQANAPALSEAQKNGWISSQTGASVAERLGIAQPEAVDAALAPLTPGAAPEPQNAQSTIESILAGLGVDSEEAAKKAKNMSQGEMWMALGKGIGQIGKGQAVDIDSIVQMRRQRLDKSATELQDVARRRAAASLVYEQSGDASMASAVGQGAISYSDFTTERQRKEVNARANAALVRQAKQNGYMAKIVGGMDSLPESEKAAVMEAITNGVPFESALKPFQLDEAAKLATQEQAKRDQRADERDATMDLYTRSSDPYENQIAKAMRADSALTFEAATEIVRKSRESAGGGEGISAQQAAENLAAARAVVALEGASPAAVAAANTVIDLNGFADPTKTQALLKDALPKADGGGLMVTVENGKTVVGTGGAATAMSQQMTVDDAKKLGEIGLNEEKLAQLTAAAPLTLAAQQTALQAATLAVEKAQTLAPADRAQANFNLAKAQLDLANLANMSETDMAQSEANLAQTQAQTAALVQANTQATVINPILTDTAVADLNAKLVQLDQDIATAPDNVARSGLEVEKLQTELEIMQSNQDLDVDIKKANLARLNQELKNAAANFETAQTKVASAAKATSQTSALRRDNLYRLISDVYDTSLEFAGDDVLSGAYRDFMSTFFKSSDAGKAQGQIQGIDANNFIENLSSLKAQSPTGASGLGSASNIEGDRLVQLFGALQVGGDPATLRENLRAMANYALDYVHGTPDQIQAAVEAGEYDQSVGDIYGARWRIDGDPDKNDNQALVGDLGAITPLRYNTVPEFTVLNPQTPEDVAGATLEEADNTLTAIGLTPAQVDAMTIDQKRALSSEHQAIIMKWLEGN